MPNKTDYQKQKVLRYLENGSLKLMAEGADSEQELFQALGIGRSTWYGFRREIPALNELIIRTRMETFEQIKGAMKRKATGYDYEETEETTVRGSDGKDHKQLRTFKKHCPPDISAQKLILANLSKGAKKAQDNTELTEWSNSTETVEIKAEGSISLALDEAVTAVLKELDGDR